MLTRPKGRLGRWMDDPLYSYYIMVLLPVGLILLLILGSAMLAACSFMCEGQEKPC